jgi:hypothetical protein
MSVLNRKRSTALTYEAFLPIFIRLAGPCGAGKLVLTTEEFLPFVVQ